jgi:hypothetical protein
LRSDRHAIAIAAEWAYFKGDAATVIRLWRESGANWRFDNQDARYDLLSVATSYLKVGQRDQARPLLEKNRDRLQTQVETQPNNGTKWGDLAVTLALLDEKDPAQRALAKLHELAMATANQTTKVNLLVDMANTLAWMGQKPAAMDLLVSVINQPGVNPTGRTSAMRSLIAWWPLQGDPRFEALVADPKNNAPLY